MLSNQELLEFTLCNDYNAKHGQPALVPDVMGLFFNQQQSGLKHVAYARLEQAEAFLKAYPNSLSRKYIRDVVTPSGLVVKSVTPFEFALGAGDFEMATMMVPYFALIENGATELVEQYAKYKQHIENMLKQEPYDLWPLFKILIKESSVKDVEAELTGKQDHRSKLRNELEKFRKAMTPSELNEPSMHYNYMTLRMAYRLYAKKDIQAILLRMSKVKQYSDHCGPCPKAIFVCRLIIGGLLRNLPARDRQVYVSKNSSPTCIDFTKIARTFSFDDHVFTNPQTNEQIITSISFPITATIYDEKQYTNNARMKNWRLGYEYYIGYDFHDIERSAYITYRSYDMDTFITNLCQAKIDGFHAMDELIQQQVNSMERHKMFINKS